MFTLATLSKVLLFLFGASHNAMYTALTFTGLNFILDFVRKYEPPKGKKDILKDFLKRLLAYAAFIIIATRIDSLAMDDLFGWNGSTQFLVCLYILSREIKLILNYIRGQGIEIPFILETRVGNMRDHSQGTPQNMDEFTAMSTPASPEVIDARISNIKQQLADIERMRQNEKDGDGTV